MLERKVTIDGTEIDVPCSPGTRYSDVLRRAASILEAEETENYVADLSRRVSGRADRLVIA